MREGYDIPAGPNSAAIEILKSRFIAHLFPVRDADAVRERLGEVKKALPGANHYVYAYRLGFGASVFEGMSDDGEPSGTAGPPVLAVVRGSGLGDLLIVVVRYFGGTKLGTGGLVRAYTEAAQAVLVGIERVRKVSRTRFSLHIPYPAYNGVRLMLAEWSVQVEDEQFTDAVSITAVIETAKLEGFTATCIDRTHGQVHPAALEALPL
jgi:uncharacterized YigZ family protein